MNGRGCLSLSSRLALIAIAISAAGLTSSCRDRPSDCLEMTLDRTGAANICQVNAWPGRDTYLHLPAAEGPRPLVLLLHGGGGKKRGADRATCPDGDDTSADCFVSQALSRGYAVAVPDGTDGGLGLRTWNTGGGENGFRCVSGSACEENVDDLRYIDDLLSMITAATSIDESRVYATGLSNGAAMTYRLACDRASRFAAIAPVAGANQADTSPGCRPEQPVSILHIHGTADPCWKYAGGSPDCPTGQRGLEHISVDATLVGTSVFEGFVTKNGCAPEALLTAIPDSSDDGTTAELQTWTGCDGAAEVQLLKIDGGGHTWPRGFPYLDDDVVGVVSKDDNASARMLDFFDRFSR